MTQRDAKYYNTDSIAKLTLYFISKINLDRMEFYLLTSNASCLVVLTSMINHANAR